MNWVLNYFQLYEGVLAGGEFGSVNKGHSGQKYRTQNESSYNL